MIIITERGIYILFMRRRGHLRNYRMGKRGNSALVADAFSLQDNCTANDSIWCKRKEKRDDADNVACVVNPRVTANTSLLERAS